MTWGHARSHFEVVTQSHNVLIFSILNVTAQKMKFSIKDFFSKCDQIRSLLKKSLKENFIFLCSVPYLKWNDFYVKYLAFHHYWYSIIANFASNNKRIWVN